MIWKEICPLKFFWWKKHHYRIYSTYVKPIDLGNPACFLFFYLTWEGYKWAYLLIACNNLTNVWSQHYHILFYSFTIRNFVYMRCRRNTITADWRFKYIILADKIIVLLQRENIKKSLYLLVLLMNIDIVLVNL